MMVMSSKKALLLIFPLVFLLLIGIIVYWKVSRNQKAAPTPITLTYWSVFDNAETLKPIIEKYHTAHPEVTINVEQKTFDSYEAQIRNAMAEGRGPDLFSVPNTWIPRMQELLVPLDASETTMIRDYFDVVERDALVDNQIYGLPYSVDSLALFYNKRLLREAGIANPPRTWDDFNEAVAKLTELDSRSDFRHRGAALGGSKATINRATDILTLFILQEGTEIFDTEKQEFLWNKEAVNLQGNPVGTPVLDGIQNYLRYSNPLEPVYTWNEAQDYSFDQFASEKVAMILSYAYAIPIVKEKNPKMEYGIIPTPQPRNNIRSVTIANYWLETVAKNSKNNKAAWDFVKFATNEENDKLYSSTTNKPASRRRLAVEQLNDSDLGAFAEQNLYATSWYQYDPLSIENILDSMIKDLVGNKTDLETGAKKAGAEIINLVTKPNNE